jgi:hypothetical protein
MIASGIAGLVENGRDFIVNPSDVKAAEKRMGMGNMWTKLEGPILFSIFTFWFVMAGLGMWKALELLGWL